MWFNWESDSEDVGDLDLDQFREYVTDTNPPRKDSPPFYGPCSVQERSFTMEPGEAWDDIYIPAENVRNYCDGYWIHDQTYRWGCRRCGYVGDAAVGMTGRQVFNVSATNVDWVIRTTYTTLGVIMIIQDLPDEP